MTVRVIDPPDWPGGPREGDGTEFPPYVWVDLGHVTYGGEWPAEVPTQKGKVAVRADNGAVLNPQPDFPVLDPPPPGVLPDPPTITSLEPASIVVNTPTIVTVTGTNFGPNMTVWVDEAAFPTLFVDYTHCRFTAIASSAGIQDITVDVAGQRSAAVQLTVTEPA